MTAKGGVMHDLLKLTFSCPSCEQDTLVTTDNTMIWRYECQPIYDIVEFHCSCGEMYRFFGMHQHILETDLSKFTVIVAKYADDDTIRAFARIYFAELPDEFEVQIQEFVDELDHLNETDCDWGDV